MPNFDTPPEGAEATKPEATVKPQAPQEPIVPEAVTHREFGDVPGTRQAIFDNVLSSLQTKYPISNDRYTLKLNDVKYRRSRDYSNAEQKRAIMRGQTLGWNATGSWELSDNATGEVVDKTPRRLVAKVPYMTNRGTIIYNGNEYTVASQMRLRPGVYTRVKDNGLIEAHFNVKGGTGPSFRVYMEPESGIFRAQIGQATLKLYPILRAMGISDRELTTAWGKELVHANVAAADPRAVQRAYTKLVPRSVREKVEEEELEKDAAFKRQKDEVNYVQYGVLQQCTHCDAFNGSNACRRVQGFISPTGWCMLWQPGFGKFAQDADANRVRAQFIGTIVCDDSKPKKPWIYMKINKGLVDAAWEAMDEQNIVGIKPHFELPHVTISQRGEAKALVEKYGRKWKSVCGNGRRVRFSLQNAMVDLNPASWDSMDRVWFLELRSPQLRAFRKSLDLPELPQGKDGEQPFHITIAVKPRKKKRGQSALDIEFDDTEAKTKAAFVTLDVATKIAAAYLQGGCEMTKSAACANSKEHEGKCNRCGDCCKIKVAVEGKTYQTSAACPFMDKKSQLCSVYEDRFEVNPLCNPITHLIKKGLAPQHCGYVDETYKSALAPIELKTGSIVDRLVSEIYKEASRYDAYRKSSRAPLAFAMTEAAPEAIIDEPTRGPLLTKLAEVLDLSQPAEEAIEDEPVDVLINRQEEAANVLKGDPSGEQMKLKVDTELVDRESLAPRMPQEQLKSLAVKLLNMGLNPPSVPATTRGVEDDVKVAYEQLTSRLDRCMEGFVKQADTSDYGPKLREVFEKMELDEDTTASTLGQSATNVSPNLIVDATRKLINVNQGKAETDDRDALAYQRVLGPEDLFAERISRDAGGVGRKMLWRTTFKGNVQHIPSGALSPQLRSLLLKSGLASPLEEVNPLEIFDQQVRVTRMGEGGMPSMDSVPDAARSVQPSHFGAIDPIRAPEGMKIGVDSRVTQSTYRGSDGQMYMDMTDVRTGKPARVSAQKLATSVVSFPGELNRGTPKVRAMVNSKQLAYVSPKEVDFELPHSSHMFTATSNLVPMVSSIKGGRLLMGAKMATQALPLRDAEAPLVQNESADGQSFEEKFGERMGAVRAAEAGQVEEITREHIKVRYPSGTKKHQMYHHFPFNRKTYLHNTPTVTVGQQVKPGQLLAQSNYTDKKGQVALGMNLRVGYMAFRGFNADDAIVISESAAKRLSSEHMYTTKYKKPDNEEVGKRAHLSLFPGEFDKRQMNTIGDNGVVKPGTVVRQGDPLVLAVNKRKPRGRGVIRGRKNLFASAAETWDHSEQGIVTDVDQTRDGWKVLVKAYSPMHVGDKLSNRYGGKGVVSTILADDEMPQDSEKKPLEILLNPLGVVSRVNPAQLVEAALGKVAKKTGKSYTLPGFSDDNYIDYAKKELQRNGLSDTEDLVDPKTGRKIPKVFTGSTYMMKLHHMAEPKASGRDVGSYTAEGVPAGGGPEGSKRIGTGEMSALVSHGATNVIRDAKVVRGQRNDDYWRALRLGMPPPSPKIPVVYDKFMAYLRGAGINLKKSGDTTNLFALTDSDVDDMSSGPITKADTVKGNTLDPIENGLFDVGKTGGHGGGRWSHIKLNEPMPNPVMEEPIRRMLGLTKPQLADVISGKGKVGNETGTRGILNALKRIKLDTALDQYQDLVRRGSGAKRDNAVKVVGYLTAMKKAGIKPEQLMMNKVPVLPPNFRPITAMGKLQMVSDPNYLYTDLMAANSDLKELKADVGDDNVGDERLRLYKSFKAVTGLGDPVAAKTQETGVKGLLKHVFGCYDKKTEILTTEGWKQFDSLPRGIPVGTINPASGAFEWQLPTEYHKYRYAGELVELKLRKGVDLLLTPNHRNWVRYRGSAKWQIEAAWKTAASGGREYMRVAAADWSGHTELPEFVDCDPAVFAGIVGWWAAEGWIHSGGKAVELCQITRNKAGCQEIERLVAGLGLRYSTGVYDPPVSGKGYSRRRVWSIKSEELVHWLIEHVGKLSGNKRLSRFILDWDKPLLEAVYRGYMAGDGERRSVKAVKGGGKTHRRSALTDERNRFSTTSKQLYDDMTELCFKLGLCVRLNKLQAPQKPHHSQQYRASVCGDQLAPFEGGAGKSFVHYDGFVYCVTVPNTLLVVRRNGKPVVSGNSSPKHGMFQRRVLGAAVDTVGRGVITPNPSLNMDQVGLPENKAWILYRPFVIRHLVRRGMGAMDAAKAIQNKTDTARTALLDAMARRPVIINRAPVLHRYGMMSAWPILTKGNTLQIPPLVTSGFNADFDGDAMNFHVPVSDEAVQDAVNKMLPSKNLRSVADFDVHYYPRQEFLHGLHLASSTKNRRTHTFISREKALAAYRRGEVGVGDKIIIRD